VSVMSILPRYCSSVTFSNHSTAFPLRPRAVNNVNKGRRARPNLESMKRLPGPTGVVLLALSLSAAGCAAGGGTTDAGGGGKTGEGGSAGGGGAGTTGGRGGATGGQAGASAGATGTAGSAA